jgi:hypothetical protein
MRWVLLVISLTLHNVHLIVIFSHVFLYQDIWFHFQALPSLLLCLSWYVLVITASPLL